MVWRRLARPRCMLRLRRAADRAGSWQLLQTTGSGPARRMGQCAALVRDAILVFGGSKYKRWYNDTLQLDLRKREWQTLEARAAAPSWHAR